MVFWLRLGGGRWVHSLFSLVLFRVLFDDGQRRPKSLAQFFGDERVCGNYRTIGPFSSEKSRTVGFGRNQVF